MKLRPYIERFCHTPYLSATSCSASASSGKFSPYLSANLALLPSSRMLMPRTAASLGLNLGSASRNPQASLVQPGVSSFG
jgi:hypothetical protein